MKRNGERARWAVAMAVLMIVGCDGTEPDSLQGAPTGQRTDLAEVAFSRVISDAEVQHLLHQDGTRVWGLRFGYAELTGSFGSVDPHSVSESLSRARVELAEAFQAGLRGSQRRLGEFWATHGEADLARDAALRIELRSLLEVHAAEQGALQAAREGSPLIYAAIVSLAPGSVDRLRGRPEVLDVALPGGRRTGESPFPGLRSFSLEGSQLAEEVTADDSRKLWRALEHVLPDSARDRTTVDRLRPQSIFRALAPKAWWPEKGDVFFDGDRVVDSFFQWKRMDGPFTTSGSEPGYEHDLAVMPAFFSNCLTYTNLPHAMSDCATAGILEPEKEHAFGLGTLKLKAVELSKRYKGLWAFRTLGSATTAPVRLYGQQTEAFLPCPDSPFCRGPVMSMWFISRTKMMWTKGQEHFARWLPEQCFDP